jgi:hypothetical protein
VGASLAFSEDLKEEAAAPGPNFVRVRVGKLFLRGKPPLSTK